MNQTWECPYCKVVVTLESFGREIVTTPTVDVLGRPIHSYRVGCCLECGKTIELVNGAPARVELIGQGGTQDCEEGQS